MAASAADRGASMVVKRNTVSAQGQSFGGGDVVSLANVDREDPAARPGRSCPASQTTRTRSSNSWTVVTDAEGAQHHLVSQHLACIATPTTVSRTPGGLHMSPTTSGGTFHIPIPWRTHDLFDDPTCTDSSKLISLDGTGLVVFPPTPSSASFSESDAHVHDLKVSVYDPLDRLKPPAPDASTDYFGRAPPPRSIDPPVLSPHGCGLEATPESANGSSRTAATEKGKVNSMQRRREARDKGERDRERARLKASFMRDIKQCKKDRDDCRRLSGVQSVDDDSLHASAATIMDTLSIKGQEQEGTDAAQGREDREQGSAAIAVQRDVFQGQNLDDLRKGFLHSASSSFKGAGSFVESKKSAMRLAMSQGSVKRMTANSRMRSAIDLFHSVEARVLKNAFRGWAGGGTALHDSKINSLVSDIAVDQNARDRTMMDTPTLQFRRQHSTFLLHDTIAEVGRSDCDTSGSLKDIQ